MKDGQPSRRGRDALLRFAVVAALSTLCCWYQVAYPARALFHNLALPGSAKPSMGAVAKKRLQAVVQTPPVQTAQRGDL